MGREFKPGDVAVITEYGHPTPAVLLPSSCVVGSGYENHAGQHWHYLAATPEGATWTSHPAPAARPLVVIDPEDREQVERVSQAIKDAYWGAEASKVSAGLVDAMQAALREFANPKPKTLLDRLKERAPDGLIDPALAEQVVKEWLADNAADMGAQSEGGA